MTAEATCGLSLV